MPWQKHLKPYVPGPGVKRGRGITCVLLGWLLTGFMLVIAQWSEDKTSLFVTIFIQFLVMFLCILPFALAKGWKFLIPYSWTKVLLRAVFAVTAYYGFIFSGMDISFVDNSLLFNTEALFIPIFLYLVFKHKAEKIQIYGVIIGFAGVATIYTPDYGIISVGGILGLVSGISMAIIFLLTSTMIHRDPPLRITFYHSLIAAIISGVFAYFNWQTPSGTTIVAASGLGLLLATALYLFIYAFFHAEPYVMAPLSYSLVIFAGVLEWLIWGDVPTLRSVIGFILILAGGLMVISCAYRKGKKPKNYFV